MKTTLELPDELIRAAKIRAAEEGRRLKDVVADLIRRGLADQRRPNEAVVRNRVRLPLIECAHGVSGDEEMTPDRVADILVREDMDTSSRRPKSDRWAGA